MQKGSALIIPVIIVPISIILGIWAYQYNFLNIRKIHNFYDCDNAGYKDPRANPPVCITPNGQYYSWIDYINQSSSAVLTSTPRSTDETANWKTYRDEKYGFSFKYPSGTNIKIYPEEVTTATPDLAIQLNTINTEDVAEKQILLFIYESSED